MAFSVTVYTTWYHAWAEGQDEPEVKDRDAEVFSFEDAAEAIDYVTRKLWVSEPSVYPWSGGEPYPWWEVETYEDPYTGEMEEKTVHMTGPDWDEAMHRMVYEAVNP